MHPPLIDGIHNYCDRCCWRCPFADRCACSSLTIPEVTRQPRDPTRAVAATVVGTLSQAMTTVRQVAMDLGIDIHASPTTVAEVARVIEAKMDRARRDPLVKRAEEYTKQAWPIARALRPVLAGRGDHAMLDAVERIEEIAGTIASKVYRAVSNTLEPDFDAAAVQSDANGSGKIARLLIDDSRRAWRVLTEAGRASADGVPARLIILLDDLEHALAARFPRALEFVRPGFDTEPVERPVFRPAGGDDGTNVPQAGRSEDRPLQRQN
jgi:hypothetical protein